MEILFSNNVHIIYVIFTECTQVSNIYKYKVKPCPSKTVSHNLKKLSSVITAYHSCLAHDHQGVLYMPFPLFDRLVNMCLLREYIIQFSSTVVIQWGAAQLKMVTSIVLSI